MRVKSEFRKSQRFSHEHVITLEDGPTLTQYYAESLNLSERGMYFESPFELYPEDYVLVRIDGYKFSQNQFPAKVVWCKKLEGTSFLDYGVGVEFIEMQNNFGLKATLPIAPRMNTQNMTRDRAVIEIG